MSQATIDLVTRMHLLHRQRGAAINFRQERGMADKAIRDGAMVSPPARCFCFRCGREC